MTKLIIIKKIIFVYILFSLKIENYAISKFEIFYIYIIIIPTSMANTNFLHGLFFL
jgi:hypothetical protein